MHRYNTAGQPGGLAHYNQADCTKCHEHKAGFRASCTACHGNPPLAAGELTGPLPGNDTGSTSWGAHNTHAETLGFVCNTCHTGWETTGEMPKVGNINIGFSAFGKTTGTYDGRVAPGGKYTAGTGLTLTQTKASNTTTCAFYCHGYGLPQWTTTAGTVTCGACHGQPGSYADDRAGAPTGVATSRDLSGALTGFKVGKHANHLDDSLTATGDPCALCHNGFGYANTTHVNGTVNVSLNAAAGGTATFTAGAPGTCANLSCHGDANWDSAAVGGCDFCHGYPPNSTNNKHASGVQAVNHNSLNITPNHDQCTYCHGYKDNGSGSLLLLTPAQITSMKGTWTPTATAHQDGSITMNGGPTAADAGYNVTNGGCDTAACHVNDATHRVGTGNTTSTKSLIAIGPGSCGACHDGGIGGAPVVSSTSSHVKVLKTGTFGDCTDCHAGHTTATGGVDIPNNATVGINYSTSGHTGIQLGGTGTNALISALTTEAEICWACHDNATNAISEWGVNNKANTGSSPYNYGTVTASNWTTATWSSSRTQFAYKTGAIQSTHTANPLVTDAALGGAAYSRTETKNAVTEIRCSNCHDVHDLNRASGDTVTGTPYLRGSWMGNPYEEDGAPRSLYANTTYFTAFVYNTTDVSGAAVTRTYGWGAVPRGSKNQAKLGGYWIDQNNVVPMTATTTGVGTAAKNPTAAWTVDQFAGLCALCHGGGNASWTLTEVDNIDQVTGEAIWMGTNGHANSVKGGTGSASANDFNVYNARTGVTTYGQVPRQHYAGMTEPGDNGSYGFRATEGFGYQPTLSSARGYGYIHDDWVVDDTGATLENQYHKFSCSKCHNPHASRLPKLMITNCLDTVHNTWDNQFQLNPQTGNNLNKELAQWTSAQNCHRYSESNNTTTTVPEYRASRTAGAAGTGAGWNKVTPWKQTLNVP
ncbi:MAG TPA: hypothetical protein DEB35_05600 [Desulfuromonas sp.]|nr:hypothetical protein [Desulfuromonas sp.]